MISELNNLLLWFAVAWPLLLAMPALHTRLPWARHLAILPAVLLVVFPADSSVHFSWLLYGSGFSIDTDVRWILTTTTAIWLMVASISHSTRHSPDYARSTPFFLLTLSGNLGAILATDLISFFTFSTLMGYSFYGLMILKSDKPIQRAARLYLLFLVLADLALFEALLLAASSTENLHYAMVRQVMVNSATSQFYIWMSLTAFILKAGIWPIHLWLSAAFKSTPLSTSLLLGSVPVAIALLGMLRCLPLGEDTFYLSGIIMQGLGLAILLYALGRFFTNPGTRVLAELIILILPAMFILLLGTGLSDPVLWLNYQHLSHPAIAFIVIIMALLSFSPAHLQDDRSDLFLQQLEIRARLSTRWINAILQWPVQRIPALQQIFHNYSLQMIDHYQRIIGWQKTITSSLAWSISITLFIVLLLTLAWLAR